MHSFLVYLPLSFFSSTDAIDGQQLSEFWNRDDEISGSEEDISDSDTGTKFYFNCICFTVGTKDWLVDHSSA
jgi:hypothetical protein